MLPACNWQSHHENSVFAISNTVGRPVLLKHFLTHTATEVSLRESHGTLSNYHDAISAIVSDMLLRSKYLGKVGSRSSKLKDLHSRWRKIEVEKFVNQEHGAKDLER